MSRATRRFTFDVLEYDDGDAPWVGVGDSDEPQSGAIYAVFDTMKQDHVIVRVPYWHAVAILALLNWEV